MRKANRSALFFLLLSCAIGDGYSKALPAEGGGVFASEAVQQNRTVTGVVKDATGEPMIGVTIQVKGTGDGTITDIDGKYTLNVSGNNSVLIFSFVGYQSQEITVGSKSTIDVVLKEDSEMIDEVVVIGFQSQKKENLTASVASVSADALEARPVSSVGQALQGMVPGLNVTINGGDPTNVPQMNIRSGLSSLRVSPLPLTTSIPSRVYRQISCSRYWYKPL